MKIHELARLSGVNPETIRMYRQKACCTRQGLPTGTLIIRPAISMS